MKIALLIVCLLPSGFACGAVFVGEFNGGDVHGYAEGVFWADFTIEPADSAFMLSHSGFPFSVQFGLESVELIVDDVSVGVASVNQTSVESYYVALVNNFGFASSYRIYSDGLFSSRTLLFDLRIDAVREFATTIEGDASGTYRVDSIYHYIPEPSSALLMLSYLLYFGRGRRCKR